LLLRPAQSLGRHGFYRRYPTILPNSLGLDSPVRLRLLSASTGVGSRYGRQHSNLLAFHGLQEWPKTPIQGSCNAFTRFSSLRDSPDFNASPLRRQWSGCPEISQSALLLGSGILTGFPFPHLFLRVQLGRLTPSR